MENPIAIEPEEETVKDGLISVLDQFKPAKSDGIECPSGMRFSTCKAHCQKRCGEDDPICDASLCRPGCICEDETAVLWENGKTCAPECLIMKPTTPPPKPGSIPRFLFSLENHRIDVGNHRTDGFKKISLSNPRIHPIYDFNFLQK